ncbi:MAG: uroporphyrinogen-III synthase [Chlorobi bacterium]|nr:uroporphyrinogen-III synthase [Chlorobiota bacterium]
MTETFVLLTRARRDDDPTPGILREMGFETRFLPLVCIEPPETWRDVDEALRTLDTCDAVILPSANAVRFFLERIEALEIDPLQAPPVATVGPAGREPLQAKGFRLLPLPAAYSAAALVETLGDPAGKRFLIFQSNLGRDDLRLSLETFGARVDRVTAYRNLPPAAEAVSAFREWWVSDLVRCVAFYSPSAVRRFRELLPESGPKDVPLAVIGETTGAEATRLGLRVDIMPGEATAEALAFAIGQYLQLGHREARQPDTTTNTNHQEQKHDANS